MSNRRSLLIPQDDGRPILLDYYDGAYGKTLRIDVQSRESLEAFTRFLEHFQEGAAGDVKLSGIEEAVLVPPLLDVRLLKSEGEAIKADEALQQTVIEWSNDQHGWKRVIGLLEPFARLAREGGAGHQYLTQPKANILVELAFRE